MLADAPLQDFQVMANIAAQLINSRISPDHTTSPHELIFGWPFTWPASNTMCYAVMPVDDETGLGDPSGATEAETEARTRSVAREENLRWSKGEFETRQLETAA